MTKRRLVRKFGLPRKAWSVAKRHDDVARALALIDLAGATGKQEMRAAIERGGSETPERLRTEVWRQRIAQTARDGGSFR